MVLRSPRKRAADDGGEPAGHDRMTLVEHLTELRSRVIKALLAIAVGAVIGFLLYDTVLDLLLEPYRDVTGKDTLLVTDPVEQFSIRIKISAYLGLVIASPVVLWQLWRFITPGLYPNEKRYAIPFVMSSIVLFVMGGALAIVTFPKTLEFFSAWGGDNLEAFYTPGKYLGLLVFMMLAFGIGFLFPVIITFLQIAGIVHWRTLSHWRRYAIVIIFVADAIITPSGDPITLLAMAIPMCLFYEASILIGRFVLKR